MKIEKINEEDLVKFFSLFKILCASLKCDNAIPNEILKMLVETLKEKGVYTKQDNDWAKGIASKYEKKLETLKENKRKVFNQGDSAKKITITFEERWGIFWEIASPSKSTKNT